MDHLWLYLTLLATVAGAASAITCYDCWYHSASGKLFSDNACNRENELHTVNNETCEGQCYVTTHSSDLGGIYVKRGCTDECEPGEIEVLKIGMGNRTCCADADNCNNEILPGAAINIRASSAVSGLIAAAILFYHTAL